MLVEGRAVEPPQAVPVAGKVGRHPVDDHADARLVEGVDERHQVLRRAEPAGGGEEPDRLVAPARREGVFRGGQKLDVREAHLHAVGDEFPLEFGVGQPAVGGVPRPSPAAQVDLVHVHRGRQGVAGGPGRHPLAVVPLVACQIDHAGGRAGRHLGAEAVGIGAVAVGSVGVHPILVRRAGRYAGNEQLPDPRGNPLVQLVRAAIPAVEVADHAHAVGIRGPDGETRARHSIDGVQVGAELFVAPPVAALGQQVEVEICQHGRKGVRVVAVDDGIVGFVDAEQVAGLRPDRGVCRRRHERLPEAGAMGTAHRVADPDAVCAGWHEPCPAGSGQEGPDAAGARAALRIASHDPGPEQPARVAMPAGEQRRPFGEVEVGFLHKFVSPRGGRDHSGGRAAAEPRRGTYRPETASVWSGSRFIVPQCNVPAYDPSADGTPCRLCRMRRRHPRRETGRLATKHPG